MPVSPDWPALLRGSRKRGADALDYFLFSPGVFGGVPAFAIGRTVWDNWLVWKARSEGATVVDATSVVKPIHQDHDYEHVGSLAKVRDGPEAGENRRLAGGRAHLYSRYDATHRLLRSGLVPNPLAVGHAGETVRRGVGEDRLSDGTPNGVIRVGYITGEPTPGRAPQLARIAEHPEIELSVIYAAYSIQRRQWSLELPSDTIVLRGPSLPLSRVLHHEYPITPQIWPLLQRERFDVLVIAGWSVFAGQAAIAWARRRRVPYSARGREPPA